jgi:GGDEF domain-containing protein
VSNDVVAATEPLLRRRWLRVLLVAAPGLMGAVAILVSMERNLAISVALNATAGVVLSTAIFLAVSLVARRVADDRMLATTASRDGQWRARTQLLSIVNEDTGLYVDWYFRLRVEEEVRRAQRYGMQFSVLVAIPADVHEEVERLLLSAENATTVRQQLRNSDLAALLRDGTLAVLLPHTARGPAVQRRLAKALAKRYARVGLASFPEDGDDSTRLINAAKRAARAPAPATRRLSA